MLAATAAVLAIAATMAAADPTTPAQTEASNPPLSVEQPGGGTPGPLSEMQKLAISQGYLVPDQAAYERYKADAARAAGQVTGTSTPAAPTAAAPQTVRSWEGIRDPRVTPSDSTGAIGPTRYIELINLRYAIYNRTSNVHLARGSLKELTGEPPRADVFDPQIIWDATTRRFYYVAADIINATDNRIAFGFSKTDTPSSAADFCKYVVRFGSRFPDYPKLGDNEGLLLIGANSFEEADSGQFRYLGSDLISITKPPAGSGCPRRDQFTVDTETRLFGADQRLATTPVPANQIDTREAGHVVATSNGVYTQGRADVLSIYRVTENPNGTMDLDGPKALPVPSYAIPANAPQPGTSNVLDTLDARNTQAVEAYDPSPGEMALWTQHTVLGGSGAKVRWYEIDPNFPFPSILQRGFLRSFEGTYFFNAAISPDRMVNRSTGRFGNAMVMGYNTSSKARRPDIRMVSKVGSAPMSGSTLIKRSPRIMDDFFCQDFNHFCRWGDYSAATPDPLVLVGGDTGRVWLSNQWVKFRGGTNENPSGWSTWNWAARP